MRKFILPLLAAGCLAFAVLHVVRASHVEPNPPPPVQPPRSPFGKTVAGAGLIEPQTENIAIGTPLSGLVQEVFVKVGCRVKAGERLFRLDGRALEAERRLRAASLAAAKAKLSKLESMPRPEELPPAAARVKEAEALVASELDQLRRLERLWASRAVAEEDFIRRKQGHEMAVQQLARTRAEYALLKEGAWEPEKAIARAEVEQAQAQLEQTLTELERLIVCASVDGQVLQVNVRPGEFVTAASGQALVMLGNTHALHLRADIDEHDLARFRADAPAYATLRGAPEDRFALRFVRVEPFVVPKKSLTGVSTERVDTRVLQVIYQIDAAAQPLFVGQQMDLFVEAR